MSDAVLGKILINGQLRSHDDVISGREHGVHTGSNEGGCSGHHFVVGVGGLLNVLNALGVQIGLGVGNGLGGVGLRQGVQQPHLGDSGILRKHHVHDEFGIQGVAGAGDIVDAGEAGGFGIGNGGIDHRRFRLLCGEGRDLGGGGGNGDDGVHTVGNGLIAELLEGTLIVLPGGDVVCNGHAVISGDLVQLCGNGVGNFVQRGVIQLLDDGHLIGFGFFRLAGSLLGIIAVGCGVGLAAAGGQRQGHGTGKGHGQEFLHHSVLFHLGFLQKYRMFERQMTVLTVPGSVRK